MSRQCPACRGTGKIETERKAPDRTPKWQLWEKAFFVAGARGKRIVFQTEYAFVSPDGVIDDYRISAPLGNLPARMVYHDEFICLFDLTGQTLDYIKQFEGWKKSSRKVSQEDLARHYLVGEL